MLRFLGILSASSRAWKNNFTSDILSHLVAVKYIYICESVHDISVFIASASNEGTDESAHVHTQNMDVDEGRYQNIDLYHCWIRQHEQS